MRRKLFWGLIVTMLLALLSPAALAGHGQYHIDYTDEPPQSVLNHLAGKWPGYTLEDYCELDGESLNVGIALVERRGHRVLAMYRRKNGEMTLWFDTDKAVPQGGGEAWIDKTGDQVFKEGYGWMHVPDNRGFAVTRYDLVGDTYNQMVVYRFQSGGFQLTDFYDLDVGGESAVVKDGEISYYAYGEGNYLGRVYGEVQTDMRYVSFKTLPKTLKEARKELTYAPDDLPTGKILGSGGGTLKAKEIKFTGGRNYPVYLGPGEHYMRSGNGKGSVSTNDWIQVFGRYEDFIMIQYDISAERYRIGWIKASALPSGANVPDVNFFMLKERDYNDVIKRCVLTDDPFNSQTPIATLEVGTPLCEIVHGMGGWSYVRVTINGVDVCGFVPSDCMNHG